MSNHLPIVPSARSGDPASSHRAYWDLVRSSELGKQQGEALALVHRYPGSTAAELAGDDYRLLIRLRKRLPELRDKHRLVRCVEREAQDLRWWLMR